MRNSPAWLKEAAADTCFPGGALLIFGGIGVVGLQCFLWLREGTWTPIAVNDVLRIDPYNLVPDWRGVAAMLQWVLSSPLSAGLFFAGLGLMMIPTLFDD